MQPVLLLLLEAHSFLGLEVWSPIGVSLVEHCHG